MTRASDQGPHAGQWDNTPLMDEILALRHEAASLAGFANFAEYSLATKMARGSGRGARIPAPSRAPEPTRRPQRELPGAREPSRAGGSRRGTSRYYSEQLKRARLDVVGGSAAALLPAAARARRPVRRRLAALPDPYRRAHRRATSITRTCGTSTSSTATARPRGGFFLDLYARPEQARRRLDGRVRRPHAGRAGARAAGRLPGLQLRAAGRRAALAADASRRADACSTNSGTGCITC